jgi:hypothetical protein
MSSSFQKSVRFVTITIYWTDPAEAYRTLDAHLDGGPRYNPTVVRRSPDGSESGANGGHVISHELLRDDGILIVTPEGRLEAGDFGNLAVEVDPYIEQNGRLAGLMIYAESFPGWDDFGALVSHLRFVREHHQKIAKVAAVTDSKVMSIAPRIVDHFVSAEIKHFDYADRAAALAWLRD